MPRYERVLLKLSGEVLAGDKNFGLDCETVRRIGEEIATVHGAGVSLSMVVGGGNMFRGREMEKLGIERVQADHMGMLGTVVNALALQDVLEQLGVPTRVQTAIEMRPVAEPYIRRRALRHLEKGRVVIFAAGTGSPCLSTDTAAALRAAEMGVQCMVKGTKVDGIYDTDPRTDTSARLLPSVTYREALTRNFQVMDISAFSLCMDNKIPILVINILKQGNLVAMLVKGERIGTIVHDGESGRDDGQALATVTPSSRPDECGSHGAVMKEDLKEDL
ncbi:MAG: UMP kinase [Synergistaceae bacterium]|jgi:uridylate kinase|nr:UMP kinase [Synergistaceae bacterium]